MAIVISLNYYTPSINYPSYIERIDSFVDERGEIWTTFKGDGKLTSINHVKVNTNARGVFRGFHTDPKTTKTCTCLVGNIVAIVIWPNNEKYETFELSSEKHSILTVPPLFFNGFVAIEDSTYMYQLSYEGEYVDTKEQKTLLLEDSCIDVKIITDLLKGHKIIRSDRDKNKYQ